MENKTTADNENNEDEAYEDMAPFKQKFYKSKNYNRPYDLVKLNIFSAVGVPKEVYPGEKRVSLTPKVVRKLVK